MWILLINNGGVWLYLGKGGSFTLDVNKAEEIPTQLEAKRLKDDYSKIYQTRLRHKLWLR